MCFLHFRKNVGLFRLKSDFVFFSLVLGENLRFPPASFLSFLMGLKALLFSSTPDFENAFTPAKPAAARFGTMKSLKNWHLKSLESTNWSFTYAWDSFPGKRIAFCTLRVRFIHKRSRFVNCASKHLITGPKTVWKTYLCNFWKLKRIFGKIIGSKWDGWPEQITNGLGWAGSKIDKNNVYPMGMGWPKASKSAHHKKKYDQITHLVSCWVGSSRHCAVPVGEALLQIMYRELFRSNQRQSAM